MARTRKTRPRKTHFQKTRSFKTAAEALDFYLVHKLVQELRQDTDEVRALRKAILGLLILMTSDRRASVELLNGYLLIEFGPLARSFSDHKHHLFGSIEVLRGLETDSRPTLFLPEERLKELLTSEGIIGAKNGGAS